MVDKIKKRIDGNLRMVKLVSLCVFNMIVNDILNRVYWCIGVLNKISD